MSKFSSRNGNILVEPVESKQEVGDFQIEVTDKEAKVLTGYVVDADSTEYGIGEFIYFEEFDAAEVILDGKKHYITHESKILGVAK